jgi:hypothetical protein
VELFAVIPGEYFIFSQTTHRRLFISPDGQSSDRPSSQFLQH